MRILLVEDDTVLGAAVRDQIASDGRSVDWVRRLDAAADAMAGAAFDLVLLDLMLPDGRGISFLKSLRSRGDVTPAIDIALSRWAELKTLEDEVADLGERLETRKAVDRAKGILMARLKISEADAFRWIQKTAMDRRMGMREVADAVVAGMDKA